MGFFTVTTDEESIRDYDGNSKYISKSGIYEVVIKAAIVNKSSKGSETIDLWIDYQGQEQPIFQAIRLTNNDGSPNFDQKNFNKLCIVTGAGGGTVVNDPVPRMVPIGKGGENKECMVLEDLDETTCYIRIQMEYSLYEGKIMEKKAIRNFFRYPDKASASEIVNDVENKGTQFEKEMEFADRITYKDDLTEEDVAKYLQNRKSGKTEKTNNKPSNGFGGKRNFGKKPIDDTPF